MKTNVLKAKVITNQLFAILGLLFALGATSLFGIMIAACYLHFDPPAWLGTQNDAIQHIGMSYLLFGLCILGSISYALVYMPPFFQTRTLASARA